MNETLKAVIVEVSGGNVRNHHINLRGAFGLFPDDSLGGSNEASNEASAATSIVLHLGAETVNTIDDKKAIFRERGAIRRFFAAEAVNEGDLVLIQRCGDREFQLSKVSKRVFNSYL